MDYRDTGTFYAKRQANNPSSDAHRDSGLLVTLFLLAVATLFAGIMYKLVTGLYL